MKIEIREDEIKEIIREHLNKEFKFLHIEAKDIKLMRDNFSERIEASIEVKTPIG